MKHYKWLVRCSKVFIVICLLAIIAAALYLVVPGILFVWPRHTPPDTGNRDRPGLAPEGPPQALEERPAGERKQGAESVQEIPSQSEPKLHMPEENGGKTGGKGDKKKRVVAEPGSGTEPEPLPKKPGYGEVFETKLSAGRYVAAVTLKNQKEHRSHVFPRKDFVVPDVTQVQLNIKKLETHSILLKLVDQNGEPIPHCNVKLSEVEKLRENDGRIGHFLNPATNNRKKETNDNGIVEFRHFGLFPEAFRVRSLERHVVLERIISVADARGRWKKRKPVVLRAERMKIHGTIRCLVRCKGSVEPWKEGLIKLLGRDNYVYDGVLVLREVRSRKTGVLSNATLYIEEGKAQLSRLENTRYHVWARTRSEDAGRVWLRPTSDRKTIRIEDGELVGSSRMVFYWLERSKVPVEFKVVDNKKGRPVAGAKVEVKTSDDLGEPVDGLDRTDEKGRFKTKLLPGSHRVEFTHDQFRSKEVKFEVKNEATEIDIVMGKERPLPVVWGYVRCDGKPVPDAEVYVVVIGKIDGKAVRMPTVLGATDKKGYYRGKLPRGTKKGYTMQLRVTRDKFAHMRAIPIKQTDNIRADVDLAVQLNVEVQFAGEYSKLAEDGGMLWIFANQSGYMRGNYVVSTEGETTICPVPGTYEFYFVSKKDVDLEAGATPPVYLLGEYELQEGQENLTLRLDEKPESRPANKLQKQLSARRDAVVDKSFGGQPANDATIRWLYRLNVVLVLAGIVMIAVVVYLAILHVKKYKGT